MVVLTELFHVPVMLFVEVVGKTGGVLPWHRGPIVVNVGVILLFTVTVICCVHESTPSEMVAK